MPPLDVAAFPGCNRVCTILTTAANAVMRPIHERMPVILDPASDGVWLDLNASANALRTLFVPYASEGMEAIAVGPWVSNARNEGPRCLELAGAVPQQPGW